MVEYISVILAIIVVLSLLLLTTKYLTYKSKKMLKGNHMQIVETLSLGVNNRIHLIKIDNEFFVISATNKSIEFLSKVNISDYEEEEVKNPISEVIDFKAVLKKYINGINFSNQTKKNAESQDNIFKQSTQGESEIQKSNEMFRENLTKLKHLNKTINGQRSENGQKKEI